MPQRRQRRWTEAVPTDLVRHWTFDNVILALLGFLLAFAMLAFGGVEAWSQLVIISVVALLTCVVLVRPAFDQNFAVRPRWIWLPAWLLVAVAALQIVPLPVSVVAWLAPSRVAAFHAALPDEPVPNNLTLSISPLDTWHCLRLALFAACVLMAVTAYTRTREHLENMLTLVFSLGCLASTLCIAQIITGATKLYWLVDAGPTGMLTAGSFVNHSHFAQFVNLAIGAGAGLILMRLERAERRHQRQRTNRSDWLPDLLGKQTWILFGLAICVFSVCLSLSRNGILSLTISAALVGSLLGWQQRASWRLWLVGIIPLCVFAFLISYGLDEFYERMATVQHGNHYRDRWDLTSAAFAAGSQSPLVGSGLGSFALMFPAFDTTGSAATAPYADNDYAQMFVEAGGTGLLLIAILAAIICSYMFHELKADPSSASQVAYGLFAGLLAIAIHSFTDFGQRIPAVFLLTVTCCGLLAALPSLQHHRQSTDKSSPQASEPISFRRRMASIAATCVAALLFAWLIRATYIHHQAETWWSVARLQEDRLRANLWQGSEDEYRRLLVASENSLALEPGNVELRFWLNFYRWMSVLHTPLPDISPTAMLQEIKPIVARIADELAAIRREFPTYHQPYTLEGQLRSVVLDEQALARQLLEQGATLAKSDPQAQFALGEWAARHGDPQIARAQLARAVAIDESYFALAVPLLIDQLHDTDTADAWANGNLDRLLVLSRLLAERDQYFELSQAVSEQANRLLDERAEAGTASSDQLAQLAQRAAADGDFARSVRLYRNALADNYDQFDWRLQLATSLRELGEVDAALRELRICLRLRPQNAQARALIEDLDKPSRSPDGS